MSKKYENSDQLFRDYSHKLNNSLSVLVASFDILNEQCLANPKAFPENFPKMIERLIRTTDKIGETTQELRQLADDYEITPKN